MVNCLENNIKQQLEKLNKIREYDEILTKIRTIAKDEWLEITLRVSNGYEGKTISNLQANDALHETLEQYYSDKISECLKGFNNSDGCKMCKDTSNDRYYSNQGYRFCPHCGSEIV